MAARSSRPLKWWLLVSLALAVSSLSGFAERVEDLPKPTNYVSDFAHVLSPQSVAQLDWLCGRLDHTATNAQVAIVTVHNLDGDDKADFANRLEEKWKVGKKGTDRGVLMLISTDDHHYWIEVGYGLEGILPDAKVGDIGRAMVPNLRAQNYDAAVRTGLVRIAAVIANDAKVNLDDLDQGDPARQANQGAVETRRVPQHHTSGFGILFRIILIVVVLGFLGIRGLFGFGLGMFLGGGGRGGWGGGGGGWGGGGGGSSGGSGFGGFGGGSSGGGGAGGDW
jgi:uncharacterized protein